MLRTENPLKSLQSVSISFLSGMNRVIIKITTQFSNIDKKIDSAKRITLNHSYMHVYPLQFFTHRHGYIILIQHLHTC